MISHAAFRRPSAATRATRSIASSPLRSRSALSPMTSSASVASTSPSPTSSGYRPPQSIPASRTIIGWIWCSACSMLRPARRHRTHPRLRRQHRGRTRLQRLPGQERSVEDAGIRGAAGDHAPHGVRPRRRMRHCLHAGAGARQRTHPGGRSVRDLHGGRGHGGDPHRRPGSRRRSGRSGHAKADRSLLARATKTRPGRPRCDTPEAELPPACAVRRFALGFGVCRAPPSRSMAREAELTRQCCRL